MSKWVCLCVLCVLCGGSVGAQTIVSATITDPTGLPFPLAQVTATVVDSSGLAVNNPTAGGNPVQSPRLLGTDGNGFFSAGLTANASITPTNTRWQFTVCLTPGSGAPAGAGSRCFTALPLTVAGSTLDVSGQLSVAAFYIQQPAAGFTAIVFDRFNRANASTLGPRWSPLFDSVQGVLGSPCILNQLLTPCTGDEFYYQGLYSTAIPGNQYAQFELGDISAGWEFSLLLRATPPPQLQSPPTNAYFMAMQLASGVHQYTVGRWVGNSVVFLRINTVITPNWAVGDVIRGDAVTLANGNTELRLYRNGVLFDVLTDSASAALQGTYVGVLAVGIGSILPGVRDFTAGQSLARPQPVTRIFAQLGSAVNGESVFCSDCTFANPCAGGGTGAIAKRLNGAWRCD